MLSTSRSLRKAAPFALPLMLLVGVSCSKSAKTAAPISSPVESTTPSASSTADASSHDNSTACALLSAADVAATTSLDVGPGVAQNDGSVSVCAFKTSDDAHLNLVRYERGGDLIKNIMAADSKATKVTGIGDDAVLEGDIGTITFVIGEIGFKISGSPKLSQAQLEASAKKVVANF